ncbi:hypothetical protein F5884DRAFT_181201 [Xylogone sp. PMI_703]|nr:hypothetical protein F5884DRAFT_181201 [Xylogone sp. PMI_703]
MVEPGGTFAVFALPSSSTKATDPGVDRHGNPVRRRKKHAKSKCGCISCKERKVKCDEARPACSNCVNRRILCRYENASKRNSSGFCITQGPTPEGDSSFESSSDISREVRSAYAPSDCEPEPQIYQPIFSSIDLDTIRLLHHFETSTCKTMIFGGYLWQHQVMNLALNNQYLMHAILLMASAHLCYLHPESSQYSEAEAYHLALTLSGFRSELSNPLSAQNADAVVACAFILLHHAWSVEFSSNNEPSRDRKVDIGTDNMLAFSAGLKNVLLSVWHARDGSIFKDIIDQSKVQQFKEWASTEAKPSDIEKVLVSDASLSWPDESEQYGECLGLGCGSMDAVERLVPVLRAVDYMTRGISLDYLVPEIAGYLLMWPGKSSDAFQKEVRENDSEALLVMLCFYTCTLNLISKDFWWVHKRSKYMYNAICALLDKDGNPCKERVMRIGSLLANNRCGK